MGGRQVVWAVERGIGSKKKTPRPKNLHMPKHLKMARKQQQQEDHTTTFPQIWANLSFDFL